MHLHKYRPRDCRWRGRGLEVAIFYMIEVDEEIYIFFLVLVYHTFLNVHHLNFTCLFVGTNFSDRDLTNLCQTIARTTQLMTTKRSFITRKWNSARLHRHPRCRTGIWPDRRTKVKDARPIRWSLFVRFVLLLFRVCAVWYAKDH